MKMIKLREGGILGFHKKTEKERSTRCASAAVRYRSPSLMAMMEREPVPRVR